MSINQTIVPPPPLVTIIIPTASRPHLLPRAVDSALAGMPTSEVEVIVVPNGANISWRESLLKYCDHPSVRVMPIETGHANAARNHGLRHARGKYVRFLDDDDFLYPDKARRQYEAISRADADVCSGALDIIDQDLTVVATRQQTDTDDFFSGIVGARGAWQPTAHVFRREFVAGLEWDTMIGHCQDFDWMLRIGMRHEVDWLRCDWPVGVWCRHAESRIGLRTAVQAQNALLVDLVLSAMATLDDAGRLTQQRRDAISTCLWDCIHAALCFRPVYWTSVARLARHLSKDARPAIPLYLHPVGRYLNPLLLEWLMVPRRLSTYWVRQARLRAGWARFA